MKTDEKINFALCVFFALWIIPTAIWCNLFTAVICAGMSWSFFDRDTLRIVLIKLKKEINQWI
jgi:hypothetical protein